MKKLNYLLLIIIVFFVSSCQKDEITVTLKQSGRLIVELKDTTGKVYTSVKVSLSLSLYSEGTELDSKKTDSKGKVDFGELQEGTYLVSVDTIKSGNKYFVISKPVQVISGTTKKLTIDPNEYSGTIVVNIDFINTAAAKITPTNVKVALIKSIDYKPDANRQKVLTKAIDTKTLDANGTTTFLNVPCGIYYYAYIYLNDNDTTGYWIPSTLWVEKGKTYVSNNLVYASSLIVIKNNFELTVNYYSSSYSNYMPVKNLNVVLIKYSDYQGYNLYNAQYSSIITHKIASGITNSSGTVVFANVPIGEYYAYGYYSQSQDTWIQLISVTESGLNSDNVSVTGSDLGLN